MGPVEGLLLLLGGVAPLLGATSWHTLHYFNMAVWQRGRQIPHFTSLAYVDDHLIGRYDKDTDQCVPQSSWIEEIRRDDTDFWARSTGWDFGLDLVADLLILKNLYNQSRGIHILQEHSGCELNGDRDGGTPRGFVKYGYNGRDFLSLDLVTLTWTAMSAEAEPVKKKWDVQRDRGKLWKHFLTTCVEWLHIHLRYGEEALLRTDPPTVCVAHKAGSHGLETLVCRLYGFYPREIDVTWRKDGEDQKQETLTGGVVPNSDGTYHTWLSIEVDPEERGCYRCRVEHDGLLEPLDLAWEEPGAASGHTLHYFDMAVWERDEQMPHFTSLAYVDDHLIGRYDSDTDQCVPQSSWIEEIRRDDADFWARSTGWDLGLNLVTDLMILKNLYNQSRGIYSLQELFGCELSGEGGTPRVFVRYGYNGRDFLSLDLATLTWTAISAEAKPIKKKWDAESDRGKLWKHFLTTCVEWLRTHLRYGKAALLRTDPPTGRVARKAGSHGLETLVCRLHGFYPKEIDVTWRKDGEDQMPDTLTGGVVPNWDGTYHTWLSIEVDPEERGRFRCRVEHDGLPEPLDLGWEEPASVSKVGLILGIVAVLVVVGIGVLYVTRKLQEGCYKGGQTGDQGSESSASGGDQRSESSASA